MNKLYLYGVQILFVCSIAVGSQNLNFDDKSKWLNVGMAFSTNTKHLRNGRCRRMLHLVDDSKNAARYLIYLLTIKSIPHLCNLVHNYQKTQILDFKKVAEARDYLVYYAASVALLVYCEESLFRADFVYIGAAFLVIKYPEMASSSKQSISYGVGMACSFFEGYLVHIIPSDGARFVGFEENIRILEDREGVLFPVKKLFIIITKNMYCPPDLKEFNKGTDVPYLESFNFLGDVQKSVAGVKNRVYRNTAYKVYRPRPSAPPLPLAAECATPLHTLHRVLANRALYREVADINVEEVVDDFCRTLRSIIDKSPQCRGKCELIFYDNEDPEQNLAEILLNRVRELVPDFEQKILARRDDNIIED